MATYKTKESIVAKGFENALTNPYNGKVLQKTYNKDAVFTGIEYKEFGQDVILVDENPAILTIDLSTKLPYNGKAQFALDPSKLEKMQEVQYKTETQGEPISDFKYYTSENFLKRASVSIVPVALIGAYCYNKKFSLTKSALLVSIPIVVITGLQYVFMGGGKNKYWGIFVPPSARVNSIK